MTGRSAMMADCRCSATPVGMGTKAATVTRDLATSKSRLSACTQPVGSQGGNSVCRRAEILEHREAREGQRNASDARPRYHDLKVRYPYNALEKHTGREVEWQCRQ